MTTTTQKFMNELNQGFDDYVTRYVKGDRSVTETPEQFTRGLLEKTMVTRLDNPNLQENLFQIVGEGMQPYRDSAAIVLHLHRAVLEGGDADIPGKTCQRLVAGVIDHLDDDVVGVFQRGIHAGALPHGIQPAQNLEGRLIIINAQRILLIILKAALSLT